MLIAVDIQRWYTLSLNKIESVSRICFMLADQLH